MIDTLHTVLVAAFVAVTALLFVVTMLHRMRVRHVRMSWRAPRPAGLVAWPILFVGVVTVLMIYAGNMGTDLPAGVFAGYLVGGVLWFCAAVSAGTVLVTEFGIVHGVGRPGRALAWVQIVDWFEVADGRRTVFVFMFEGGDGALRRLELPVPTTQVDRFRYLVRDHLEERAVSQPERVPGRKALEG